MNKKSIASLELAALVNELQLLVKGKISQIFHQEKKELLLQLHAVGKGKQFLRIIPGKLFNLTEKKEAPLRPSSFCMQLRKYINNSFIRAVYQKDAERVVVFELEKEKKYYFIIELFSKGNVILTDGDYEIITVLERQIWKDRVVKPKVKYIFPTAGVNWKKLSEVKFKEILVKSEKNNLAVCLATELGLGGLYAEEICKRSGVDKKSLPNEVSREEIKLIVKEIKNIVKLIETPSGFIYDDQVTPFALIEQEIIEKKKTYNEAINTLNLSIKISPYEKKIIVMERIIANQEEAIKKLQGKIELNKRKGELIYEKYQPLQKMLDIVKELKKSKSWQEVSNELKKEKKIKSVSLKNKKVVVEL